MQSSDRRVTSFGTAITSVASASLLEAACSSCGSYCTCLRGNINNVRELQSQQQNGQAKFQIALMGLGFVAGVAGAVMANTPTYDAAKNSCMNDTASAEWACKMLSGIAAAAVDVVLPIAGATLGGWLGRCVSYSGTKLGFFSQPQGILDSQIDLEFQQMDQETILVNTTHSINR